jgi:hypothetical protein
MRKTIETLRKFTSVKTIIQTLLLTCSSQQLPIRTKTNCVDGKMTFGENSQQFSRRNAPHSYCGVGGTGCKIIAVWMKCDALEKLILIVE